MWKGQSVSVVFSTYRDLQTIRQVIDGLFGTGLVDEIVAVDNNAEEGTREQIALTRARRVVEPKQGVGHGFLRGLREATGDIVITMEVDGTYRSSDIQKLLAYSDDFEVVCGTRTASLMIRENSDMDFITRWPNVIYAKIVELLFNTANLTDVGCIFRLMKRPALERIVDLPMDGGWAFPLDWMLQIVRNKIRFIEIPVNFFPRGGKSVGAASSRFKAAQIAIQMFAVILKHRFNIIKCR